MVILKLVEKINSPVSKKDKDDTMVISKLVEKIKSPVSKKHKSKVHNSFDILNFH